MADLGGSDYPDPRSAHHCPHPKRLGAAGRTNRAQHRTYLGLDRQRPLRLHMLQGSGQKVGSRPLRDSRAVHYRHLLGMGWAPAVSLDSTARHNLVEPAEEVQHLGVVEEFTMPTPAYATVPR